VALTQSCVKKQWDRQGKCGSHGCGGTSFRAGRIISRAEVPGGSRQTDRRGQAGSGNREARAKRRDAEQMQVRADSNRGQKAFGVLWGAGEAGRSGTDRIGNRCADLNAN